MSFGFGVGDFFTVGQFCWKIYKRCKDASEDFKNLSSEVGSFHNVLKETEELLSEQKLSPAQEARFEVLKEGSENVLKDLDKLLVKYESLGTKSQRTWDVMGFGKEDITALRLRLMSQTTLLDAFNNASSHARLEQKLNILITEIRAGKREGSIISSRTFNSVAEDNRETWRELRRELEDIGISPAIITEKRQFIITWFEEAIAAGGLEDSYEDDSPKDNLSRNDSDGDFFEAQPLSLSPPHTPEQLTTNQARLHQLTEQPEGSILLEQTNRKKKKSRLTMSNLLNILLRRDDQLIEAARIGDYMAVEKLLEKEADVNVKTQDGVSALYEAASGGHEAVVRLLLEKGADINAKTKYGNTALYRSASGGHEAVVRLLLEKGANVNVETKYGNTALYEAASGGHEAVVRLLLEKGADINAETIDGNTALYGAARGGYEAVVRLLLEKGADINAKTIYRNTVLYGAARGGHEAVVRLLLEKGANVNAKTKYGVSALYGAAYRGHEAVVRLLLEKGANVNAKTIYGNTALYRLASGGHEAVVRLLLEKGADVNTENKYGETSLYRAAGKGHEAVVRLLLEKGADVNTENKYGETSLYRAAGKGHEAVVRLLLEKGADVNTKTETGETALSIAALGRHEAVVRLLQSQ